MLVKPPLEDLMPHVENRYTLAITIAKRTRQLVSGAQPMAETESPNLVTLACEELAANQIAAIPEEVTPEIPLRPEVIAAQEAARLAQTEEFRLSMQQESEEAVATSSAEESEADDSDASQGADPTEQPADAQEGEEA